MSIVRRSIGPLAIASVIAASSSARAAEAEPAKPAPVAPEPEKTRRLKWPDAWPKFHPVEYVATVILVGTNLYLEGFTKPLEKPVWTEGILFDDWIRGARLKSPTALKNAGLVSDFTSLAPQLPPIFIDALLLPVIDGSWDTVWQMEMINAQAYALTGVLTRGPLRLFPRQRPVVEECKTDPTIARCNAGPNASFPSGHTSFAFTGAGLTCAHHLHIPLMGSRKAAVLTCVGAASLATTTAVLRVLTDRHWTTDVLVGAGIGVLSGYVMPVLLHYRGPWPNRGKSPVTRVQVLPIATETTVQLSAVGIF